MPTTRETARSQGFGLGHERCRPSRKERRMGAQVRRILIADDNRDAADSAAILLRLAGYDARAVYGGAEAVLLARAFSPDVAILDINMPRVDGYDVAGALIAESAHNQRPFLIALSALSSADDVRRSLDAGFDHHVVKPAASGAVVNLIEAFSKRTADGEQQSSASRDGATGR